MAATHLVCVFAGAPAPVQEAATAMPVPASDTSPNNAGASIPVKLANKSASVDMDFSASVRFPLTVALQMRRSGIHRIVLSATRSSYYTYWYLEEGAVS